MQIEPIALQVYYEGQEKDRYDTYFGAFKTTFKASENFTLKFIGSAYHTLEQEYLDIYAGYYLGEVDSNIGSETFGGVTFSRAIGTQLNHARNDLDALIVNTEIKGFHDVKKHQIEWGFKYTREDIRDRIVEWEVIDSAGFNINPPIIDSLFILTRTLYCFIIYMPILSRDYKRFPFWFTPYFSLVTY